MPEATRLVTAEELEKSPDDDYRYELVEGRVVRMSPVGFRHGRTVVDVWVAEATPPGRQDRPVVAEVGCAREPVKP